MLNLGKLTQTLRGKLTLWYVISVGLVISAFVLAMAVLSWFTLQDQIDHHVHIAVNEAREIVQNYQSSERDELLKNLVSAQGMTIIVLSPDGAPVLETNSPDVALVTEHQLQGILSSTSLTDTIPVHFTQSGIRFAAIPVSISAGKGILAVGYSTRVLYATFQNIIMIVAGIVVFLVLPITYGGFIFLRRQLHPLESIAAQAKKITARSSLSKRIALNTPTKELENIQDALNTMLTQLEQVFTRESEFFANAAHTLKTPLAVLRSQVENSSLSQKSQNETLSIIDSTNDTIQDLLFLTKIGTNKQNTTTFSLSQMLENLAEIATALGEEKGLKITSDIDPGIKIDGDQKLIQRALSNLIHNAVIYNKSKGSIDITLTNSRNKINIVISDTGIGINKKDQTKVFSRFYRGSNNDQSGSGLGLAITKAVVSDMSGTINLDSKANRGTKIEITLPKLQ